MISRQSLSTSMRRYCHIFDKNEEDLDPPQVESYSESKNMLQQLLLSLASSLNLNLVTLTEEQKSNLILRYVHYISVASSDAVHKEISRSVMEEVAEINHRRESGVEVTLDELRLADDPQYRRQQISNRYNERFQIFIDHCADVAKVHIERAQQPSGPPRQRRV